MEGGRGGEHEVGKSYVSRGKRKRESASGLRVCVCVCVCVYMRGLGHGRSGLRGKRSGAFQVQDSISNLSVVVG